MASPAVAVPCLVDPTLSSFRLEVSIHGTVVAASELLLEVEERPVLVDRHRSGRLGVPVGQIVL